MEGTIKDWKADDISKVETQSTTHLEDDKGQGTPVVIRVFTFKANPEAFKQHTPSQQELFNYHYKFIETMLWKDGLKPIPEVEVKITINKRKTKYRIFVGATPAKGQLLYETPQTLSKIANPV